MIKNKAFQIVLVAILLVSGNIQSWAAESASVRLVSDKGSNKILQAETIVDAPVDAVWEQLTDYGKLKNIIPGYDRSTVLQSSGNTSTVDIGLKGSGLVPAYRYQVKIQESKPAHSITIQRISGDFKTINASYKLISVDNGTRTKVVYKLDIDLGNVSTFGASQVLKSNTEKGMVALQSHCARSYRRSLTAQK